MIELTVRLVASLAIVVGLLLLTVRLGARRFRPRNGAPLRIVHRQALSRSSSLAVVEVGGRVLVLGTTEHQINVLAELEQDELDARTQEPEPYADDIIDMEAVRRSTAPDATARPTQPVGVPSPGHAPQHVARHVAQPVAQPVTQHAPQPVAQAAPQPVAQAAPQPVAQAAPGPLAGSVLSAQTWRDAFAVAMGRS